MKKLKLKNCKGVDMERQYRYLKKVMKSGTGNYILIPTWWIMQYLGVKKQEVVLEIEKDKIHIKPI